MQHDDTRSVTATCCVITGEEGAKLTALRLGQWKKWYASRLSNEGVAVVLQANGDRQILRAKANAYTIERRRERQASERKQMDDWMKSMMTEESDRGLLGAAAANASTLTWAAMEGQIHPWGGQKYKGWKSKGGQSIPCLRWYIARALLAPSETSSSPTQANERFLTAPGPNTPKAQAEKFAWYKKAMTDDQLRELQRGPRSLRAQLVRGAYAVADRDGDVCPRIRRILLPLMRVWLPDEEPTPLRWEATDSESGADLQPQWQGGSGMTSPYPSRGGVPRGTGVDGTSVSSSSDASSCSKQVLEPVLAHGVDISTVVHARLARIPRDSGIGSTRWSDTLRESSMTRMEVELEKKMKKDRLLRTSASARAAEKAKLMDARIAARQVAQQGRGRGRGKGLGLGGAGLSSEGRGGVIQDACGTELGVPTVLARRIVLEPSDGFRLTGRLRWTTKLASADELELEAVRRHQRQGTADNGESAANGVIDASVWHAKLGSDGGRSGDPAARVVPESASSRRADVVSTGQSVDADYYEGWGILPRILQSVASPVPPSVGGASSASVLATPSSGGSRSRSSASRAISGRAVATASNSKEINRARDASSRSQGSRGRRGRGGGEKGSAIEWTRKHPPVPRVRRRADSFGGLPSSVFSEGKTTLPMSLVHMMERKESRQGEQDSGQQGTTWVQGKESDETDGLPVAAGAVSGRPRSRARRWGLARGDGEGGTGSRAARMSPIDGLRMGMRLSEISSDRRQRRQLLAGATNAGPADTFGSLGIDRRPTRSLSPGRGKKFEKFSVRGERLGAVDLSMLATYLPQHAVALTKIDVSWCPKFDSHRLQALEETISMAGKWKLQELDVSYCRLRDQGAAILARSLCGSKCLRVLRAAGCLLGSSEAPAISAIMLSCPALEELHLAQNDFRPTGARAMEQAVLMMASRQSSERSGHEGSTERRLDQLQSGPSRAEPTSGAGNKVGSGAELQSSVTRGRAQGRRIRNRQRRRPTSALPAPLGAYRSNRETRRIFAKIDRSMRNEISTWKARQTDAGGATGAVPPGVEPLLPPGEMAGGLQLCMPKNLRLLGLRSCGLGPSGTAAIASLLRAIPSLTQLDVSDNNATAMGASTLTAAARSAGKPLAVCTRALIPGYPGSLVSVFSEDLPGEQAVRQRRLLQERKAKAETESQAVASLGGVGRPTGLSVARPAAGAGAGESKEGR